MRDILAALFAAEDVNLGLVSTPRACDTKCMHKSAQQPKNRASTFILGASCGFRRRRNARRMFSEGGAGREKEEMFAGLWFTRSMLAHEEFMSCLLVMLVPLVTGLWEARQEEEENKGEEEETEEEDDDDDDDDDDDRQKRL